ncbi:MAG: ATP synthase subunit I [Gammaproteobacteria bacterium]|nr:MAG: ATP synthase subunit I [Gammaproteobacteria bacterium]
MMKKIPLMIIPGRIIRVGQLRIEQNFAGGKGNRDELPTQAQSPVSLGADSSRTGGFDQKNKRLPKNFALRVVLVQLILTLLASALFWLFLDLEGLTAGLTGGISSTLPHLILVYIMFASKGSKDPKTARRLFFWGEVVKTVLISTMLAVVVIVIKPKMLPMLVTFALTYVAFWISLMRTKVS